MTSFGQLLRVHRRQCRDELRGGLLTQERLGELLGDELGGAGYSGAAVSDWERDKSSIDKDDRLVLIGLVSILRQRGGLHTLSDANALLLAGNYRPLNGRERRQAFPDWLETTPPFVEEQPPQSGHLEASPSPNDLSPQRRKQHILLQKVKNFWVKGVLEQSVQGSILLDIAHRSDDELIAHPWRGVVGPGVYDTRGQPIGKQAIDVFQNADHALLVLGTPGSGKTTTLLMLARDLIQRAEKEHTAPIPIVFGLVSWVEKRVTLAEWIVEELVAKYQIPSEIGREWLQNDELLLLLDGFDEVPERNRGKCAAAINDFRETHGLTGIVVCSRIDEYQAADTRLKMGGAIHLEPLTPAQVDEYLSAVATPLTGLRSAMERESRLRETARSPLMLSIMRLAFHDADGGQPGDEPLFDGGELDTAFADPRRQLFANYVERMFRRRFPHPNYTAEDTKQWLSWLAQKMSQHNQNMFFIEQIQPSWLPTRRWRTIYLLATRMITGFFAGIAMWLLLLLLRLILAHVPTGLSDLVASLLGISPALAELLTFIVGNLVLALIVALMQRHHFERRLGAEAHLPGSSRQGRREIAAIGLVVGLLSTAVLIPFGEPLLALAWGITKATLYMVVSRFEDGHSYRNDVRMVEALGWSWSSAAKGLGFSLLLAAVAEGIETTLYGFENVYRVAVTFGAGGVLLGGLRGRRLQETAVPNQGVLLSLRNAVIAALAVSLTMGIVTRLMRGLPEALITMLFMLLLVGALYGGSNVIKHYLVRLILWRKGNMPRDYIDFLDHAAGLVFMRKVGGGYIFTHRLLQEYFAQVAPR